MGDFYKCILFIKIEFLSFGNIKFCSKIAKKAKQAKSMFEFSQPFSVVF